MRDIIAASGHGPNTESKATATKTDTKDQLEGLGEPFKRTYKGISTLIVPKLGKLLKLHSKPRSSTYQKSMPRLQVLKARFLVQPQQLQVQRNMNAFHQITENSGCMRSDEVI